MQEVVRDTRFEISIIDLFKQLWEKKLLIILVTCVFSIGGVFFALFLPNQYKAEVMIIPSEATQSGGLSALASQFGGLAGMAGINLSGNASKKPKIALQILKSKTFLIDFIHRNNLQVLIFAAEGWDIKENKMLINPKLYDEKEEKWVRKFEFPKQLIPSDQEIYLVFSKMVDFEVDVREGTYSISVQYFNPILAAKWANMLVADLNEHMRKLDIEQARKSVEYLNLQLENTSIRTTESVFFDLIEEQTKKAMLAQVQEDYIFSIIDPALAPENKSEPKRALICILFFMLGFLSSSGFVMLIHYLDKNKK